MKPVFHLCKIIAAYFFIFFIISSCNDSATKNVNNNGSDSAQIQPVPGAINITGVDANGNLVLKDNHGNPVNTREGKRNEVINWIVQTSEVDAITGLAMDTHVTPNDNVFSELPHQQGNRRHWKATIADLDPTKSFEEKYYIQWLPKNSNQVKTFDPKIQLNPTLANATSSEKK